MSNLPKEPSGIAVHDGMLCIVGNESNQAYFRFELEGLPDAVGVVKLKSLQAVGSVEVPHDRAEDLESIAVLEDRIVVLSEASRRIIGDGKTLIDCSQLPSLREDKGGRGLEGMAILSLPNGCNRIAVIWEGGVHKTKKSSNRPARLLTYQVGKGAFDAKVRLRSKWEEEHLTEIKLDESVDGLRFRCPDLVWCWSNERQDWALLLLLSTREDPKPKYLQAFEVTGNPIGEPVPLEELGMPRELVKHNWEGLCWHTDSVGMDSLLLCNDTDESSEMHICRIRPPQNCQQSNV